MHTRQLVALALVTVCLGAAPPARASGSARVNLLSASFRYVFAENSRKIFAGGDQAADYYASIEREVKLRFLRFQPAAEKALADAQRAGTPIGPHDLLLPEVALKRTEDVAAIAADAFPLNLVLEVGGEDASERFVITAARRLTAQQVRSLSATLKALADKPPPGPPDTSDDDALAKAGFVAPFAVTHVDERFAVYFGVTTEVAAADAARMQAALRPTLDKLVIALREALSKPDVATQLHMKGLRPIEPVIKKHAQGLPGAFHPWGPLFGGSMVRIRRDVGAASAILMLAPTDKPDSLDWPKVHPVMSSFMEPVLADAHHARIEAEAERLLRLHEAPR
jgi:hypothetical protein